MKYIQYSVDRFSDRKVGHPNRPATLYFLGLTIMGDSIVKHIKLTKGKFAIVDDEHFEWLNQFKWHAAKMKQNFYAARRIKINGEWKIISMHRFILGLRPGDKNECDHKNHNTLDNHYDNLRICTHKQNSRNKRLYVGGSSIFKGVSWAKARAKWQVHIQIDGHSIFLGRFDDEVEAAKTYDIAAKEHFGEYAFINFSEKQ